MSLSNIGPVNIIHKDDINYCTNKCKFIYKFKETSISVTNKGTYLLIVPGNKNTTPVTFSSTDTATCQTGGEGKYSVQEIRIYAAKKPGGSLHTYNGQRSAGEVLIYLTNTAGAGNLLISIPISATSGVLPDASSTLSNIIQNASRTANSKNETTGVLQGLYLNLNTFIPKNTGFYTYTASLPYPPNTECVNYIIYQPPNSIHLSLNVINKLTSIISRVPGLVKSEDNSDINYSSMGFAYNKKGAIFGEDSSVTVMDCSPVGNDGEVLVDESKDGTSSPTMFNLSDKQKDTMKNVLLYGCISLLLLIIMLGILRFFSNQTPHSLAKTGGGYQSFNKRCKNI